MTYPHPPFCLSFLLFSGLFAFHAERWSLYLGVFLSLSLLLVMNQYSSFKIVKKLKPFDMLLIDGAHLLAISITLLELCNNLLAVCMNKMTLEIKHNLIITQENVVGPHLRNFQSKYLIRISQFMARAGVCWNNSYKYIYFYHIKGQH